VSAAGDVIVVGAGTCGLATALGLARRGVRVHVVEQRHDPAQLVTGRPSINLTLGVRGLDALSDLGLAERVMELGVQARARHIHTRSGESLVRPYGNNGEAILSLRRTDLVGLLLQAARAEKRISIQFGARVLRAEPDGSVVVGCGGAQTELRADLVVGADGLNSRVRRTVCEVTGSVGADPQPTGTRWLELEVSGPWPGSAADAVDVWPYDPLMLIAFPNRNSAKTVLLFAPQGVAFPDFEEFKQTVTGLPIDRVAYETSLRNQDEVRVVRCPTWHAGRLCIAGDAAHAMAPYLGQGANAALADARELGALVDDAAEWEDVGRRFEAARRPEMECLARLTDQHFDELSRNMGDREAALRRDLRLLLAAYFPGRFQPIYNRVAFSRVSLREAERSHSAEESVLDEVLGTVFRTVGQIKDDVN
jgi:2-polyprenyl-6-methoxyphenol hydroxylase and related FAD-dependent oxidoreductases